MLQLQVQPAYGLTIHKVQALTIKHVVNGCLEGVFAQGQMLAMGASVFSDAEWLQAFGRFDSDGSGQLDVRLCLRESLLAYFLFHFPSPPA